jgi:general secretion pathway protein F
MKSFEYVAIDSSGEKITGHFIGTEKELQQFARNNDLFILSIKEKIKNLKKGKFTLQDFILFIEELVYLVSSGLTLDKALTIMSENSEKEIEKNFIVSTIQFLREGNQLSKSLNLSADKYNITIDQLTILLIKTNEAIGRIDIGLQKAKEHLEFQQEISKNIKQAMGYPVFLIIMSISMVFFVFLFIVPKFATIFTPDEFDQLPALSKYILSFGLYVEQNIDSITSLLIVVVLILFIFKKQILTYIKKLFIYIPMFRRLQIELELSYFFASMNLMLDGGIDIKNALVNSSEIIKYPGLKNLVNNLIEGIKRGITLSDVFKTSSLIDSNIVSLIAAGESSASLPQVFLSLSKRYATNFKDRVKRYISILEPLVIVMMGGVIAIIVVSIMLAVMSITDVV